VFHRALAASRQLLRSFRGARQPSSRHVRLRLEELETRALLSASTTSPLPAVPDASSLVAEPNLDATPMASGSTYYYYTPQQVRQAYGFTQTVLPNGQAATGAGQTIAIVDAYHDPNIGSDLHNFDVQSGLPDPSFQVVSMNGVTQVNTGWASETALDVEWAHAVAPQAKILLVEATSNNYSDLLAAVQYAANQPGVVAVSMSWGGSEFSSETSYDSTFTTPAGHIGGSNLPGGITFITSSGDNGAAYGAQWPAVSPNVLSVGGTSLVLAGNTYYGAEAAWSGSGGGYSTYESEPSFQSSVQSSGRRTSPDVAYDANPHTGFLVYNSVGLQSGYSGWWIVGGTSAGAPQWAGIFALADQARAVNGLGSLGAGQKAVYNLSSTDFHDITIGSNGYSAGTGYDLATGRGSPYVNRIVADLAWVASLQGASSSSITFGGGAANNRDEAAALPAGEAAGQDAAADLTPVTAAAAEASMAVFLPSSGEGWVLPMPIAGVEAAPAEVSTACVKPTQPAEASRDRTDDNVGTVYFLEKDLVVTTKLASHFVLEDE
jgi:subtilase family serine protease